ncbi:MAG: ThiF family adenylyltransferase [Planctomycetota bacterium]
MKRQHPRLPTDAGPDDASRDELSVTIFGLGNIGSQVAPHVARLAGIRRVTLVDRDLYEESNLRTQQILRCDLGQPKVEVQARRLRSIRPDLRVRALYSEIDELPLGLLRATVLLSCLDSRGARRTVNEISMRLGVPWIDAGIRVDANLARVTTFIPGRDRVCLECSFTAADYAALDDPQPCDRGAINIAPTTGGASYHGALAAALQALELAQLLSTACGEERSGRDLVIEATHGALWRSRRVRNPQCRLSHDVWSPRRLRAAPHQLTLGSLTELARVELGAAPITLAVQGRRFARAVTCRGCGLRRSDARFVARRGDSDSRCQRCSGPTVAVGDDGDSEFALDSASALQRSSPLTHFGLRAGDVLSLQASSAVVRFELPVPESAPAAPTVAENKLNAAAECESVYEQ